MAFTLLFHGKPSFRAENDKFPPVSPSGIQMFFHFEQRALWLGSHIFTLFMWFLKLASSGRNALWRDWQYYRSYSASPQKKLQDGEGEGWRCCQHWPARSGADIPNQSQQFLSQIRPMWHPSQTIPINPSYQSKWNVSHSCPRETWK